MAWTELIDLRSLSRPLWGGALESKPLGAASSCLLSWCPSLTQPQQRYHLVLLIRSHGPQVSLSRELGLSFGLCGNRADRVTWLLALTPSCHYNHWPQGPLCSGDWWVLSFLMTEESERLGTLPGH